MPTTVAHWVRGRSGLVPFISLYLQAQREYGLMDPVRARQMELEFAGKILDGWTIVKGVGSGKSAVVFRATRGTEEAAVKVFDRELVERYGKEVQLERIKREVSLTTASHPHLVQIYGGGFDDTHSAAYVVMQFIPQKTLWEYVDAIPRERVWPIISQLARAARYLEDLGFCHRDIKVDNAVVNEDFGHATLLDLGVLRPVGPLVDTPISDEDELSFLATAQYSSPEYWFRKEDNTQDGWRALTFYQLGGILHDLIMRKRLFADCCSPRGRLTDAIRSSPPILHANDVDRDLLRLAQLCLHKDPVTRLRWVTWDSFDPPSGEKRGSADVERRIRERIALAGSAPAASNGSSKAEVLGEAIRFFQSALRDECVVSGVFPPIELIQLAVPGFDAISAARFTPQAGHPLQATLVIVLGINVVEAVSAICEVRAAAWLGEAPPEVSGFQPASREVVVAPLDAERVKPDIRTFAVSMLEAALDAADARGWIIGSEPPL